MKDQDIKVIVLGRAASGKSTIASIIERALVGEGLLVMPDVTNPDAPIGSREYTMRHKRAVNAITPLRNRDMVINIQEVQMNRSGTFDPRIISQTMRPGR